MTQWKDSKGYLVTLQSLGISFLSEERAAELGLTAVSDDYTGPTEDQLKTNEPSIAGSRRYTVTASSVAGDTVIIGGVSLTATASTTDSSDYAIGSSVSDVATNIATALNANSTFTQLYKATSSGAVITVTEVIKGNGNTPAAAVCTGSIAITSGDAITSVRGYATKNYETQSAALQTAFNSEADNLSRAIGRTTLLGGSATDAQKAAYTALKSWLDTEQEALIDEL